MEHLFRHESARLVTVLTRIFGAEHLGLAEDVVQESFARALQTWPVQGIPDNPAAWIMRTARNQALDVVRREKNFRDKEEQLIQRLDLPPSRTDPPTSHEDGLADDTLRMMFMCCHPEIPREAQAALALKTLCGFSIPEISRAFLVSEEALAKRLTRARKRIQEAGIRFELPDPPELAERVSRVLHTLYLLFNEGYKASVGDQLVRPDICAEALRLARLLAQHETGQRPDTHALLALMLLHAARFPARVDAHGNLLRLRDQDRSRWDRSLISEGMVHLAQAAAGESLTAFHLEAGIAATHACAPSYAETDWVRVLRLYDHLVLQQPSPIVALNRAVALGEVQGPQAGLEAALAIPDAATLQRYYLFHAVLGDFEARLAHPEAADAHFRQALELAGLPPERRFLQDRIRSGAVDGET
ncbi:MAG: sigma-70 family RNA polymerase sigma factor [Verrucomicrobiales bacterium]|nr:sigma-70 family RNA polymerase sigma factor [Verrucomicrobiales bacterium]